MEKKSLESAPNFQGRSGNRKHTYFFIWPNVYPADSVSFIQETFEQVTCNVYPPSQTTSVRNQFCGTCTCTLSMYFLYILLSLATVLRQLCAYEIHKKYSRLQIKVHSGSIPVIQRIPVNNLRTHPHMEPAQKWQYLHHTYRRCKFMAGQMFTRYYEHLGEFSLQNKHLLTQKTLIDIS